MNGIKFNTTSIIHLLMWYRFFAKNPHAHNIPLEPLIRDYDTRMNLPHDSTGICVDCCCCWY